VGAPRFSGAPGEGTAMAIRWNIGLKIYGIAVGLLILMAAVAALSMRMTRTVDDQLRIVDENYFPAYAVLAQANIRSVDESAYARRWLLALGATTRDPARIAQLDEWMKLAAKDSDALIAEARLTINRQIADPLDFNDNVSLGRLDTRIEFLQELRRRYEAILAKLRPAAEADNDAEAERLLADLDELRDDFDRRIDDARNEMRRLAAAAIVGTRDFQQRVVKIGLVLVGLAVLLGLAVAATVTFGLVRPVHRLLAGTVAVERGQLDTVIPVTSRDEIGLLTMSFNTMVGELRIKAQIRETFGKYVDPRIVEGLIDRPELTETKGSRRRMTILFCDMKGFTSFSEGMTPVGLVNVMNRYLTVMSDAVRQNGGIIDKYIGDAVMAFWGPPFTGSDEQGRLACGAALAQLVKLVEFRAELPDLTGIKRGLPEIDIRVGIATGDVVVGNIGSEQTRNYTVIGDTVNFASRLEGVNKTYHTRILLSEATVQLALDTVEVREIDSVLVVGKSEPQRIFELLGHRGEIGAERLALRDAFEAALGAYRLQNWDAAEAGFQSCLALQADDAASQVFLERIAHFRTSPPPGGATWNGVWALTEK
jgi:adenylate cyclase